MGGYKLLSLIHCALHIYKLALKSFQEKSGVLLVKEHDSERNEDTENFTYTPQLLNGIKPRFKQ